MLFNVPGATSSPGFPATVTRPGLVVCLNCRWEPRCRTTDQPSSSSILTTSRIFTMRSTPRSRCLDQRLAAHAAPSTSLSHDVPSRTNHEGILPPISRRCHVSPRKRPQKRPHHISSAANCSEICTSKAPTSVPWAQGVAACPPKPQRRRVRIQSPRPLSSEVLTNVTKTANQRARSLLPRSAGSRPNRPSHRSQVMQSKSVSAFAPLPHRPTRLGRDKAGKPPSEVPTGSGARPDRPIPTISRRVRLDRAVAAQPRRLRIEIAIYYSYNR